MPSRALSLAASLALALSLSAPADAIPRDPAARAAFRKANPCPSTGQQRGRCPGFEIDHRIALMLGGPDTPENMQWLDRPTHRAKTRAEFAECKRAHHCRHRGIVKKQTRQLRQN
jgi:hypothetical protein